MSGFETEGAVVFLANDVGPVTNMVGDSVHPFGGVFNGNGHTLTVAITGADCSAPFSVIDGAPILNLVVTGTDSGGNHSAGLVGTCGATGPNVIRDCTVSVAVSGAGYLGGIVGHGGQGTLSFEGCVFSGAVSGFTAFAGGLMGWSNTMALNVTNCLSAGTFAPAGGGAYHPIACKRANQTVTAVVADAYWINTVVPTTMGGNLIPGAEGTPVSATLVAGGWAQPVTAADGYTYYALAYKNPAQIANAYGIGFYKVRPGVRIPQGRAYLKIPNSDVGGTQANAREFFAFDVNGNNATGITPHDTPMINDKRDAERNTIYDL